MENLTWEMILRLPEHILKESEKYEEYTGLLSKDKYNNCDVKKLKNNIRKEINRYKDIKYMFKFSEDYGISLKSSLKDKNYIKLNKISNPVADIVSKRTTDEIWLEKFYNIVLLTATKLSKQESIYFVYTFFMDKSEEIICEILSISRNKLQNIKRSCLVKVWNSLNNIVI